MTELGLARLMDDERLALGQELIDSVQGRPRKLTAEQVQQLEARLADATVNPAGGEAWGVVEKRLRCES